jgi:DDE superfamily endonuclease
MFVAYASPKGRAMIDRELYLPESWTEDPARCRAAGVPEQVGFRTKPQLAQVMLARALAARVPPTWVTADEVYGGSPTLRQWLEGRGVWHVLAVRCTELLEVSSPNGVVRESAEQQAAAVPAEQWVACSAGQGAKGRRLCDWTRLQLATPDIAGMARWLLVRRSRDGELAFYICYGPAATPLIGRSSWPGPAGRWRCVNHSALIYADWRHDLGSRCGLLVLGRPSAGGCTSQAGGIGAGGARRAGGRRRG